MAARLLGISTMALSADSASALLGQLTEPHEKGNKFETNEGHLTAAGFVLAQLLIGAPGHLSAHAVQSRGGNLICFSTSLLLIADGCLLCVLCRNLSAASGVPSVPEQALASAAQSLCSIAEDAKKVHAATAALALGHAGLQSALPLPISLSGRASSLCATEYTAGLHSAPPLMLTYEHPSLQ